MAKMGCYGCTKLEYLESTGTRINSLNGIQYIDTKYILNYQSKLEFKAKCDNNNYGYFFKSGTYNQGNILYYGLEINYGQKKLGYYSQIKATIWNYSNSIIPENFEVVINRGKLKINNNLVYTRSLDYGECNTSCEIMRLGCKYYYFKLYDNDTLVRDYIPVLDKNNRPCLFDKVEKKCYYNQGSGEFLYG